jgi:hypothetical protein
MLKIVATKDKLFELTDNAGTFLGKLQYENWLNSKASITTQYGEFYDLTNKGFWKSHVEVEKGGDLFADLRHNWRGNVIIDIKDNDIEKDFLVTQRGFWKQYYVLLDRDEITILTLTPAGKWYNQSSFHVEITAGYETIVNETLILLATFGANGIKQRQRAAAAGAA